MSTVPAMDPDAAPILSKRLEKNTAQLAKLEETEEGVYKELREAKAMTETGFGIHQKFREAKMARLNAGIESGKGVGAISANVGAAAAGVSGGIKHGVGMLQSDKFSSKEGMKSMASTGMQGLLHTAGVATGNPLFNLMASGLGKRSARIQEARGGVEAYEREKAASESTTNNNSSNESSSNEEHYEETTAIAEGSSEHLREIERNTEYARMYLQQMAENAGEAQEDRELSNTSIGKSKLPVTGAKAATMAKAAEDATEGDSDDGVGITEIVGANMLTNFLKGPGLKSIMSAALPLVIGAAVVGATGFALKKAWDGFKGMKSAQGEAQSAKERGAKLRSDLYDSETGKSGVKGIRNDQDAHDYNNMMRKLMPEGKIDPVGIYSMEDLRHMTDTGEVVKPSLGYKDSRGASFKAMAAGLAEYPEMPDISSVPGAAAPEAAATATNTTTVVNQRTEAAVGAYPNSEAARAAAGEAKAAVEAAKPTIIVQPGPSSPPQAAPAGGGDTPTVIASQDGKSFGPKLYNGF